MSLQNCFFPRWMTVSCLTNNTSENMTKTLGELKESNISHRQHVLTSSPVGRHSLAMSSDLRSRSGKPVAMLLGHPGSSIHRFVRGSITPFIGLTWSDYSKEGRSEEIVFEEYRWNVEEITWRETMLWILLHVAFWMSSWLDYLWISFESFCISAGSPHAFGRASALSGAAPGQSPEADELAMFWRAKHVGFRYCFRCGNLGVWQSRMDSNEQNELILGIFWKCTIETETVVVMENSWWEVSPSAGILGSYHNKAETVVSLSLSANIKQELKTRPLAKSSAMLFLLWIGTRIFWIHSCLTATAQWTRVCL